MKKTLPILALTFLVTFSSLFSQMERRKENSQGKIEKYRKIRMMEVLEMDEKKSIQFFSRYNKQRENMSELAKQRDKILKKLKTQISNNSQQSELDATLQQYLDMNNKMLSNEEKFLSEIKDVLSPQQVVKYVIFQQDFRDDMRAMMNDLSTRKKIDKQLRDK